MAAWTERERGEGGGRRRRSAGEREGQGRRVRVRWGVGGGVIYGREGNWAGGLCWAGGGLDHFFAESPPSRLSAKRAFSSN
jgi:hypothetical protein